MFVRSLVVCLKPAEARCAAQLLERLDPQTVRSSAF
jgi:hypothetical protein